MNSDCNLLQYDYTVCPPNWGMEHTNAIFYRMYYICGGEAYYKAGENKIPLKPGYFYILPLMSSYTLWHNKEEPLEVLWFHAEIKPEFYSCLEEIKIEEGSALYFVLQAIQSLLGRQDHHAMIAGLFEEFLSILYQEHEFQTVQSRRMQKVVAYIENHLEEEITVSSMANYAGMERSYFTRRFKEAFHMPPNKYLYAKRMSEAAKLLLKGELVLTAAVKVGYQDEKAFSRAFRNYMEMSPSQFKKRHIEQP